VSAPVAVLLTLLAIVVIQVAVWVPLPRRWRRRSDGFVTEFTERATLTGERIVIEPESAVYRGSTGPYSRVKGNGTMLLSDRRLVFRKLTGGMVEVPLSKVTGVRQSKGFNGSRVGGMTHLVVATDDPAEVGFFVQDLGLWERALARRQPAPAPPARGRPETTTAPPSTG
jgi:hypothetical protein